MIQSTAVADLGFEKGGFKVGKAHLPRSGPGVALAALPRARGSGGMPPQKNFRKYRCSEVQFGAFWSRNRIASGLAISCFSKVAER